MCKRRQEGYVARMETENPDDWAQILREEHRLWAWCARLVRWDGWCRVLGEDDAVAGAFEAARLAIGRWKSDELPPRAFVMQAIGWKMGDMAKSGGRVHGNVRQLLDRDAEELVAPDDTFQAAADRDELEVFRAWCGRQGRAGALLWRRVAGDPAEELARAYGLSASQVRRELARASQEARGRLDG